MGAGPMPIGQPVIVDTLTQLMPAFKWLIPLAVVAVIGLIPIPGRGPGLFARKDPWRLFKYGPRAEVIARASGRCESAQFIAWGRCTNPATDVDHIYPWSKGGPTAVGNGQALCREHNLRKSNLTPAWWYIKGLERRRASYFPPASEARVRARMTEGDLAARAGTKTRNRHNTDNTSERIHGKRRQRDPS